MQHHQLMAALDKIHCQKESKILFGSAFTCHQLNKHEKLNNQSSSNRPIYFLASGLLHCTQLQLTTTQQPTFLHPDPDPAQITGANTQGHTGKTIKFYQKGQFFFQPNLPQSPDYHIWALSNCVIYQSSYEKIEQLYQQNPEIIEIILAIQDQCHRDNLAEISMLRIGPAIARYQHVQQQLGIERLYIPQKTLASYLLISTKHLERLNRQLLKK